MTIFIYVLCVFIIATMLTSWKTVKGTFLFRYDKTESQGWKNFRTLSGIYAWVYLAWGIYNLVIWIIK